MHVAAQYLAAANLSFVNSKTDDSHSNLGWDSGLKALTTHSLSDDGLRLALSYEYYSLDFLHPESGEVASFPLNNAIHLDLVNWIVRECEFMELRGEYKYDFHYELPYEPIADDFRFPNISSEVLNEYAKLRSEATERLGELAGLFSDYQLPRTWPHHFDTGSLGLVNDGSIGYGLGIPDSLMDTHYYYVSGYRGHDSVDVSSLPKLSTGEWKSGTWNGAILKASENSERIKSFLRETTEMYQSVLEAS